jgi:flagellar biosynthesis GTPase FlhF
MENQLKEAKRQLLKDELAGFEFNAKMENRVLEKIKVTKKVTHIQHKTKRLLPVILSACLIALFFGGIYTFVIKSDSRGTIAKDTNEKITVKEDNNTKPPENENTAPQEDTEEETIEHETNNEQQEESIEPETNSEQQEETSVTEQTEAAEPGYFDQEFISLAEKGFLKGVPIQVGTTVGEIKAQYGEPFEYGAGEGAFILEYDGVSFYFHATVAYEERVNVKDDVLITGIRLFPKEELYLRDMKTVLGEPVSEGINDMNNKFYVEFKIGSYLLITGNDSGEDDPLQNVEIHIKN